MCAFSQSPFAAFDSRYFTSLPFWQRIVFGLSQVTQVIGIKAPLSCHKIQFASHNPCYLVTEKTFYGENTIRIWCFKMYYHGKSTSKLFYSTVFEQQRYNFRSRVWFLGKNPDKFQHFINHRVHINIWHHQKKSNWCFSS